jgi:hypothetical protein
MEVDKLAPCLAKFWNLSLAPRASESQDHSVSISLNYEDALEVSPQVTFGGPQNTHTFNPGQQQLI